MEVDLVGKIITSFTRCIECPVREKALFKNVPDDRLQQVQSFRESQIKISTRSELFQEGEVHNYIYTLFSGWGVIYKTVSNNGKRQILRFLLPGDLIGYQVDANGAMSHSAASVTEAVFCVFPRDNIKVMLKENPDLAIRLVDMESRDMSLCQNHLMAAGRKTARESIAYLLMELYYRVRYQVPGSYSAATNSIDFPITQEDVADAVGLTKIHVNRVIKALMKEKLIDCHKKRLTILDERTMCEIAEFNPDVLKTVQVG